MTAPAEIRRSVDLALDDLQRLRTVNDASTVVRHAIDLTRITLECFWIPALDVVDPGEA